MKNKNLRLVALSDGTGMGDEVLVFKTNAPVNRLKELEKQSCEVYINGGDSEDVPIWADILIDEGYTFDLVGEHQHVTAYSSSSEWLKEKFPEITEHYVIENQPKPVSNAELARRICDCLSDGYDDEEYREETEISLYNELSQISSDSIIKAVLKKLCERIEDLEM